MDPYNLTPEYQAMILDDIAKDLRTENRKLRRRVDELEVLADPNEEWILDERQKIVNNLIHEQAILEDRITALEKMVDPLRDNIGHSPVSDLTFD